MTENEMTNTDIYSESAKKSACLLMFNEKTEKIILEAMAINKEIGALARLYDELKEEFEAKCPHLRFEEIRREMRDELLNVLPGEFWKKVEEHALRSEKVYEKYKANAERLGVLMKLAEESEVGHA
jgi:hypothetical protein